MSDAKKYCYSFLRPCDIEDIEKKYFCYYAYHKIKTELDVVYRLGSNEFIPILFFKETDSLEYDYDFSRTMPIDGFYDPVNEFVAINPDHDHKRLLQIIAHECYHLWQDREAIRNLNMNCEDVKNVRSDINSGKDITDELLNIYRSNPHEIAARGFAAKYKSWRTALCYLVDMERGEWRDILNFLDMRAYPPVKPMYKKAKRT